MSWGGGREGTPGGLSTPGRAIGEPLFTDVKALFQGKDNMLIIGGRYGLSSKDTTPAQIVAVFDNLDAREPKADFTIGIVDDVTFKSLPIKSEVSIVKPGTTECKEEQAAFDYLNKKVGYKEYVDKKANMKNSQFAQPLFEFSGACAGCGETPNIKTITQLFGDHMMVANATGCSSIYGASFPASPYCTNAAGHGPAWANSLFEDFCEFGLGMKLGSDRARETVASTMKQALECECCSNEIKALAAKWLEAPQDAAVTREVADKIVPLAEQCTCDTCKKLVEYRHFIVARSQWIFGGDGASYDIGYGGLDHVLASGENVNILVLDTEVYSNTGGQSSKATPVGAIAKFAASGKKIRKKDLGMMAISYGYVYVGIVVK